jgi:hypothetical protein
VNLVDEIKNELRIPYPLAMVIVTILLAIISYGVTSAVRNSGYFKQVEINTGIINNEIKPDIQRIKETKADKVDLQRIYHQLDRIETKLDEHVAKKQ